MVVAVSNTANANFDPSGTSSHSFTGQSTGTAASDRLIFVFVGLCNNTSSAITVSAVTIGGNAATNSVSLQTTGSGPVRSVIGWWWASVPTGTTATIAVSYTAQTSADLFISVYRVVGANTTTPVNNTNTAQASNTDSSIGASLAIATNGAGLGCAIVGGIGTPFSWTNLTLDNQQNGPNIGAATVASSTTSGTSTRSVSPSSTGGNLIAEALVGLVIPGGANNVTITATQAKVASLTKNATKFLSFVVTQSKAAVLAKSSRKAFIVTQTKVAALSRSTTKQLQIVLGKVASLVRTATRAKVLSIAQGKTASVVPQFAKVAAFTIIQAKTATLGSKSLIKFITVQQPKVATLAKNLTNGAITIVQVKTAFLARGPFKIFTIVQPKVAVLGTKSLTKYITITQTKTAHAIKGLSKNVTVAQGKTARLVTHYAKNLAFIINQIKTARLRVRPQTPAQPLQVLKNVITRQRIIKNTVTRVRILKNIVTRRIP